jgi:hypothetical protein
MKIKKMLYFFAIFSKQAAFFIFKNYLALFSKEIISNQMDPLFP